MNWKGRLPHGIISDDQVMHCDIYATLLDAAGIPVPKMNGKNPVRGTSLMPHMLSSGKKTIPDRSMIFELWGNIGLRKGDYKLWADVGRDHSPDWPALAPSSRIPIFLCSISAKMSPRRRICGRNALKSTLRSRLS